MRLLNKRITFVVFLLVSAVLIIYQTSGVPVKEIPLPLDSLVSANHIKRLIRYQSYYPFINYDRNYIEFTSSKALDDFFRKIPQTPYRKLKILHFGDSHLQADILAGTIRERLQQVLGYGGRGLIFPFKAAGTHAAYDYRTFASGVWHYTRNTQKDCDYEMGMIGATVHTSDSNAGFKFIFRDGIIRENFTKIRIYCKQDSASFDLRMKTNANAPALYLDCNHPRSGKPYVEVNLPKSADTLEFTVNKTDQLQTRFECYGLMIESATDNGVLYNSTGINGAGYKSILKQKLFGPQLQELNPDLVIIDLGANDFFAGSFYEPEMAGNLKKIIEMIQKASPSSAIILTCAQDIYYRRRRDVVECRDFSEMTKKIAREYHCGYYNYYDVSGGKASMAQWYRRGLAQNDKVHLTAQGYNVRGELFLNALLNSYVAYLSNPSKDSLLACDHLIDTTELKKYFAEHINFGAEYKKNLTLASATKVSVTDGGNKIYYTIRPGDNLGSIAQRFGVSVRELQSWNGLSGSSIVAGKALVIYKKGSRGQAPQSSQAQVQKPAQATVQKPPAVVPTQQRTSNRKASHTVKSGDTLWTLAQKYNTTVDAIKRANRLSTDKLNVGQILLIP